MAAALLSHFPPQALDLWDSNTLTGTPSLEARTTFHRPCANPGLLMSLRLGGTETLCHHAITHTHTTTLVQDVVASSKFFFSHIKTSLFLLGIWIPAFTFQAFTSMTLVLPYIQSICFTRKVFCFFHRLPIFLPLLQETEVTAMNLLIK